MTPAASEAIAVEGLGVSLGPPEDRRMLKVEYKVLTKRAARLEELDPALRWADHIWMGVSVEDERVRDRVDHLRRTTAHVKFLSVEPMIGPLPDLDLSEIDWVIVGGESGPGARPIREEWVLDLLDQSRRQGVAFFFKQWGGVVKKKAGRELLGRTWDEYPRKSRGCTRSSACRSQTAPRSRRARYGKDLVALAGVPQLRRPARRPTGRRRHKGAIKCRSTGVSEACVEPRCISRKLGCDSEP